MAKYIIDVPDNKEYEYVNDEKTFLRIPISLGENETKSISAPTFLRMTPYTEPDRKAIEDEVWDFSMKTDFAWISEVGDKPLGDYSYQEAKAKYEAWKAEKAKKDEIRIGDEVIYHGNKYVVGYVGVDEVYHIVSRNWMRVVVQGDYQIFKTGRHFPEVAELKKKMGEE